MGNGAGAFLWGAFIVFIIISIAVEFPLIRWLLVIGLLVVIYQVYIGIKEQNEKDEIEAQTEREKNKLSPTNIKKWIKTQKDLASSERRQKRLGNKSANPDIHESYVRNMKTYLRSGDWIDMFYGEHQEKRVRYRCVALAYDKDGNPKRNVGTFYPDIGMMWTQELQDEERGISRVDDERPKRKRRTARKRGKRAVEKQDSQTA